MVYIRRISEIEILAEPRGSVYNHSLCVALADCEIRRDSLMTFINYVYEIYEDVFVPISNECRHSVWDFVMDFVKFFITTHTDTTF